MESDLLYSGLILTAAVLSLWTGALLAAACVFFASAVRSPMSASSSSQTPPAGFERSACSELRVRGSKL
jgi:hypothetical protein